MSWIRLTWPLLAAAAVTRLEAEAQTPLPPPQKPVNFAEPRRVYVRTRVDGWSVFVEKQLHDERADLERKALERLRRKLAIALRLLPEHSRRRLRGVTLYLMYGPNAVGGGRDNGLEYFTKDAPKHYPTLDTRWRNAVVIYSAQNYVDISDLWALKALVHEFAHAWQLQQWPETQPDIVDAWKRAMAAALYRNVKDEAGEVEEKAWACTNQLEYFAELSCMYFARCNYYPFDREDLRTYDPVGYEMVRRMWRAS